MIVNIMAWTFLTLLFIRTAADACEDVLIELFLLWRTLVSYGLCLDSYHSLYSSLITRLTGESGSNVQSAIVTLLTAFLSSTSASQNTQSRQRVTFRCVSLRSDSAKLRT